MSKWSRLKRASMRVDLPDISRVDIERMQVQFQCERAKAEARTFRILIHDAEECGYSDGHIAELRRRLAKVEEDLRALRNQAGHA